MKCDGGGSLGLATHAWRLATTVALSVVAAVVCAPRAAAQMPASGAGGLPPLTFDAGVQSAPMVRAAPAVSRDPVLVLRAEGGSLSCCSTTGFIAGGGVTSDPKALDGLEIDGDAAAGRFGGLAIFYFAADGLYGVPIGRFRPYGGAGLGIVKTTGGGPTNTGAQIVAGVQWPDAGRHPLRVEARFLFLPVETTFVLGSVSF